MCLMDPLTLAADYRNVSRIRRIVHDVSIRKAFMPKQQLPAIAAEIDRDLRVVRQILRRPVEAEIARGQLTKPARVRSPQDLQLECGGHDQQPGHRSNRGPGQVRRLVSGTEPTP